MIVVTGPNGNVGHELVRLLETSDLPYAVASRRPAGDPARHRFFDYADKSTYSAAFADVRVLFLLFPLPHPKTARTWMIPAIDAAVAAGCKHIIYLSVPGAESRKPIPHHQVEQHIRKSGVDFTILQPSFFAQNLSRDITTHAVDIAFHDEIVVPAGRGKTSFIDARDVAEVALNVMRAPAAHRNETYVLTGPERLDFHEVAAMLSAVTGRGIRYRRPSLLRFVLRMLRRRVAWDIVAFMALVYTLTRFGKNAPVTDTLARLLGRAPRTMRQYLADYAAYWQPSSTEASEQLARHRHIVTPFR